MMLEIYRIIMIATAHQAGSSETRVAEAVRSCAAEAASAPISSGAEIEPAPSVPDTPGRANGGWRDWPPTAIRQDERGLCAKAESGAILQPFADIGKSQGG